MSGSTIFISTEKRSTSERRLARNERRTRPAAARAVAWVACIAAVGCIDASQRMAQCPTAPGGASHPTGPVACDKGMRPAADGLIDDFEDDDTQLSKIGGRDGFWFVAHDDKGSTIGPTPLKWADAGGTKAVHVTGQTAADPSAWGSQLGANFLSKGMYDASKYAGISFRAKVGANATAKWRFKVGDVNTHPDGGVCTTNCWNHFGEDLTLTTDWKEYQIAFSDMKQEPGWGDQRPAIVPAKLISVNWSVGPGQTFDLWVDDLRFIECQ